MNTLKNLNLKLTEIRNQVFDSEMSDNDYNRINGMLDALSLSINNGHDTYEELAHKCSMLLTEVFELGIIYSEYNILNKKISELYMMLPAPQKVKIIAKNN